MAHPDKPTRAHKPIHRLHNLIAVTPPRARIQFITLRRMLVPAGSRRREILSDGRPELRGKRLSDAEARKRLLVLHDVIEWFVTIPFRRVSRMM